MLFKNNKNCSQSREYNKKVKGVVEGRIFHINFNVVVHRLFFFFSFNSVKQFNIDSVYIYGFSEAQLNTYTNFCVFFRVLDTTTRKCVKVNRTHWRNSRIYHFARKLNIKLKKKNIFFGSHLCVWRDAKLLWNYATYDRHNLIESYERVPGGVPFKQKIILKYCFD